MMSQCFIALPSFDFSALKSRKLFCIVICVVILKVLMD